MENSEKYLAILPFIGAVCCLIRFFWILYFYKTIIKRWETAIGVITNNEVKYKDARGDGGWENSIEYTFNVGTSIFVSTNFSKNIGLLHFSRYAVEIDENYHIGKSVTVYYNSEKPKHSIIESNFSLYNLCYIIFAVIFILIAYCMWN